MDEDARGRHMRHDGHEVHGLMARRFVDAKRIRQASVIVAGVCDAAHDRDRHALHAIGAVEAVYRADEAGCVAACELQELLVDTLFKVCIAVEEHVGHVVFLAALEDGLFAVLLIENAVFRADARVGRVEQDVTLLNEIGERTGNRNAKRVKFRAVILYGEIQRIGHTLFFQCANGKGWGHVRHADELHIPLQMHAIRQPLADRAVSYDADFYLIHERNASF